MNGNSPDRLAQLREEIWRTANKVAKWRNVFASWQLGTRLPEDPECQAVKDQREVIIMLRAEVNALTAILHEKEIATDGEFGLCLLDEFRRLDLAYEQKFPGFKTTDDGVTIDPAVAVETTRGWRP